VETLVNVRRSPSGGKHDESWPDWYAEYLIREHAGKDLPF
jgi:hypothetical protein